MFWHIVFIHFVIFPVHFSKFLKDVAIIGISLRYWFRAMFYLCIFFLYVWMCCSYYVTRSSGSNVAVASHQKVNLGKFSPGTFANAHNRNYIKKCVKCIGNSQMDHLTAILDVTLKRIRGPPQWKLICADTLLRNPLNRTTGAQFCWLPPHWSHPCVYPSQN